MNLVVSVVMALLGASVVLVLVRLVRGPSILDRAVALDVLLAVFSCGLGAMAVLSEEGVYVPVLLAMSLLGFIGSVTVARFARGHVDEEAGPGGSP